MEVITKIIENKDPFNQQKWNINIGEIKLYIVRYLYNHNNGKYATIIFTENFYMIGKPITNILNDIKRDCICNGCIYTSNLPINSKFPGPRQYIQLQGDQREKSARYFILNLGFPPEDIKYDF